MASTASSTAKTHGTAAAPTISIPPAGEEARIALSSAGGAPTIGTGGGGSGTTADATSVLDKNIVLRHGSSLSLIAAVCSFLADPGHADNFSYIDPNGDQGKWRRRGMNLYYCAVTDPATGAVLCAARCATQGLMEGTMTTTTTKRRRRILIDYLYTIESARDRGIARQAILYSPDGAGGRGLLLRPVPGGQRRVLDGEVGILSVRGWRVERQAQRLSRHASPPAGK